MNEEAAAADYLVDYLSADTTLAGMINGVWLRSTPTDVATPLIKIDRMDANDLMVINLFRVWADLSFLVRAAVENRERGQPDWTEVRAISDRIDALLHDHEAATADLEIHSFREESFTDETIEDNKLFLHAGGIYRLRAHAL